MRLIKETSVAPFKSDFCEIDYDVKEAGSEGTIKGYGSTFDDKPDAHGHIIVRGAFQKSLSRGGRNRTGVMMLRGHDPNQIPGVWTTVNEDAKGLYNEGKLFIGEEGTELGKETYALLKHRAIQHQSIGYDLPRDKTGKVKPEVYEKDEAKGITYLKMIDLWEISLVAFPANINARVTRVKEFLRQAQTEREFEQALRDLGLSKSDAQYVVSLVRPSLRDAMDADDDKGGDSIDCILSALRSVNSNIL